jgi:hypothetical protein
MSKNNINGIQTAYRQSSIYATAMSPKIMLQRMKLHKFNILVISPSTLSTLLHCPYNKLLSIGQQVIHIITSATD